jgi:hypothetical protein
MTLSSCLILPPCLAVDCIDVDYMHCLPFFEDFLGVGRNEAEGLCLNPDSILYCYMYF